MLAEPLLMHVFLVIFAFLSFFSLFLFVMEKMEKLVFFAKKMISTSQQHAEHLLGGRNTQQLLFFVG